MSTPRYFDDDAPERPETRTEETAPQDDNDKAKKKNKQTGETKPTNRGKIDKEESKKNKKGKKGKKGILKKIVIGGIVIYVSVFAIASLVGSALFSSKEDSPLAPPSDSPASYSTYSISISSDDGSTMILDDVDLGYFYVYDNNGKNELVRTSPQDTNIHYAHDNSTISGLTINSSQLTPLYQTSLIQNISKTGDIEATGTDIAGYDITITEGELNYLLGDANCDERIQGYTDDNGNTYDKLSDFLDAVEASNRKSR